MQKYWGAKHNTFFKKNLKKKSNNNSNSDNESDSNEKIQFDLSSIIGKTNSTNINININHLYFNNNITPESTFELNKELRNLSQKMKLMAISLNINILPIYLHLTTDGGCIHSALSVIDCIKSLTVPVHTVIDGFVASAGTLISLAGEKRYMCENSYMLIHELRSGVWGKMTEIEEEYANLKKITTHLKEIYAKNTKLTKKELSEILKKDIIWDIKKCIQTGLVHEKYTNQ